MAQAPIPYGRQTIGPDDIRAVAAAMKSSWLTQGPKVLEFEKSLARAVGAKYAVAVSNGTAALHLAFAALGIGPGDEVIVPAITFAATSNMVLALGGKPVFGDIRPETGNIDVAKIGSLITKKTRAIAAVHFAGHSADMDAIRRLAKKHRLKVVEDAAHALGARYRGQMIGSGQSDAVTFSFHPVKSITTGEGGAVLTPNRAVYESLLLLRNHGMTKDQQGFNIMTELGFNYRLTDIQAALGSSQLKKLKKFITTRQEKARWYQKRLSGVKQIILPVNVPKQSSAWHLFVIRTRQAADRDKLRAHLVTKGILTQIHYPHVYNHPYYLSLGYQAGLCAQAEVFGKTCLSLPLFPTLTRSDQERVARAIESFYAV